MNIQFLEKLSNADGIASNEQEVRDVLVAELKEYADEVSTDHLGSIIFKKGNRGPKIMLCAHIDGAGHADECGRCKAAGTVYAEGTYYDRGW